MQSTAFHRNLLFPLVSCIIALACRPALSASHPPLFSPDGIVASDTVVASEMGAEVLAAGGNAVDAAVATALVLGVVSPFGSGIGGGGFALVYDAGTGEVVVFDFRERAPAAASRDMMIVDGEADPELSRRSGLAVGTPGEVAGLFALHQAYGRLEWAAVVAPAATLAREGFVVSEGLAGSLAYREALILARPALAAEFRSEDGDLVHAGELLERPGLATTLDAIALHGPAAFYTGAVAEAIVATVQAGGGVMTLSDLAGYEVAIRSPLVGEFRGLTLYTMPPPSSGGTTIIAALEVLEEFALAKMGHNSSGYLHVLAEALQFAFADRAVFLGDADFVDVPYEMLVDPTLGAARSERVRGDMTLPHDEYGLSADGVVVTPPDDGGTSHLSVVDSERNMVALTTTINTGFGALLLVEGTGVVLNNEMDDFSAQPGVPNAFGLIGREANAIAPLKRPLSSMSPTLVLRDGEPFLTLGGSGGPRIITSALQTLLNIVVFDFDVSEAVDAPRIHHQWSPEVLYVETGVAADVTRNLAARGHVLQDSSYGGSIQVIEVTADGLFAASDPRKGGWPAAP